MDQVGKGWFVVLPWYRKVVVVLLMPFVLPIGVAVMACFLPLFGALYLWGFLACSVFERRFRSLMRRNGRLLTSADANNRIAVYGGTLIVESPSAGWGNTRAWWVPESATAISPHCHPSEEEYCAAAQQRQSTPWDQWCFDNLVSPDTGRALLLRVRSSKKFQRRSQQCYPNLEIVTTWSAFCTRQVQLREA